MKFFTTTIVLYLATLALSSPFSKPIATETEQLPEDFRAATPDEVASVFGSTFEEFLAAQVSPRSDLLSFLFRRSTQSVCQNNSVLHADAYAAIVNLANLPAGTRCGNSQNAPKCSIMKIYKSARLGICGPKATSVLCSTTAKYLQGIANTCSYTSGNSVRTGGYQALNENTLNYVFIDRAGATGSAVARQAKETAAPQSN
jgi:hypothetical protein